MKQKDHDTCRESSQRVYLLKCFFSHQVKVQAHYPKISCTSEKVAHCTIPGEALKEVSVQKLVED